MKKTPDLVWVRCSFMEIPNKSKSRVLINWLGDKDYYELECDSSFTRSVIGKPMGGLLQVELMPDSRVVKLPSPTLPENYLYLELPSVEPMIRNIPSEDFTPKEQSNGVGGPDYLIEKRRNNGE